jgi:hypothetical protein
MLLSLEVGSNLEYLKQKLTTDLENPHLRFPPAAIKKIKEILLSDQMYSEEELLKEIENVLITTNNFTWKIKLFLVDLSYKLSDQVNSIGLTQLGASFCIVFFFFFLNKRFKFGKKLAPFVRPVIIRFGAMMGYFYPVITLYAACLPSLIGEQIPFVRFLMPPVVMKLMVIFDKMSFCYLYFFVIIVFISSKIPKSRFIRFHFIKGLYLSVVQQIPLFLYQFFFSANPGAVRIADLYIFTFLLNVFWILPGIWEALTLNYPKYYPLRESIELNLGRDPEDGFEWWDRKK